MTTQEALDNITAALGISEEEFLLYKTPVEDDDGNFITFKEA